MIGRPAISSAPAAEPVLFAGSGTVYDAQTHLRLTGTTEQTYVEALIKAARRYCEDVQGRAYITQTWTLTLDAFPDDRYVELPRAPLQSVTSIKYTPDGGVLTTFAASNYIVDTTWTPGRIVLTTDADWPTDDLVASAGVVITYKAGYGDAGTSVPETIKQAILLLVGHLYEHREAISEDVLREVPMAVQSLLQLERVYTLE